MPSEGPVTITPILVADLDAGGERMPVCVHLVDHPDGRILVDTGVLERHPMVEDMDPRPYPLDEQDLDLSSIDLVVNTHLHYDHAGGNRLFPGVPIHVQRVELEDALGPEPYTIREWVDRPELTYVPADGEVELLPGVRLVLTPGHTRGSQSVVVESEGRTSVICGDAAVWFEEYEAAESEGLRTIHALDPDEVWLSHVREPWRRPGA